MTLPRLVLVTPDRLAACWPALEQRIAAACERSSGKYGADDVYALIRDGDMHLFAALGEAVEAIAITEIVDYPRRRVCRVLAATGDGAERWTDLLAEIERWAAAQGCTLIEPIARPGWSRRLAARGYRTTHVLLEKDL